VDNLIFHENETLEVHFDMREGEQDDEGEDCEPCFWLRAPEAEFQKISSITDTEDVSYVSSPYLPQCLRGFGPDTNDNTNRAHESAAGASGLKDELDENVILKQLNIIVGEWIPFGANQIVALNEKLGSTDRCQGGLFTGELDNDPTATSFQVPPGLTNVAVLDFNEIRFLNIEAQINFAEDEGIIQVEEFGMHFGVEGKVLYGMKMNAIQDRKADDMCIDLLARVLVDVHLDSSRITKDLISAYQTTLLETAFMNDAANRDKFNLLIADAIMPKLEASQYLDGEDNENELKQVLGDTQGAYNLTPDDVLITGRNGMLIAGPNSKRNEPLLVLYVQLHSRNMFMRVFFTRTFVLGDELRKIRDMIGNAHTDPTTVDAVRDRLSTAARDIILMTETMGYMGDSLDPAILQPIPPPDDLGGKELHRILNNDYMIHNLQKRVRDLRKNIAGCLKELQNLGTMTEVINTKQLEDVYKGVEKNTKALVDAAAANERAAASLEIMQIVFAASMAFDIVDKVTGLDLNIEFADWQLWICLNIAEPPGRWFIVNVSWCFFMCFMLKKFMSRLAESQLNFLTFEVVFNTRIDSLSLKGYLDTKDLEVSDGQLSDSGVLKSAIWDEDDEVIWEGAAPHIEMSYDATNGFLLVVAFSVDRKLTTKTEVELQVIFMSELAKHNVVDWDVIDQFERENIWEAQE
jgi:hypothetical protein